MNNMSKKNNIKILMASAEIVPFAKAGGLADVVGSLPPALRDLGVDIRLIMPKYGSIDEKKYRLKKIFSKVKIPAGGKIVEINIFASVLPGTDILVYFIDYPEYFGKPDIYWGNGPERFIFFSLAVLHVLPIIEFRPDVIHAHDYHTAILTDLVKVSDFVYSKDTKTLFTVHNLNYQGKAEIKVLRLGNLHKTSLKTIARDARDGDINFIVQGMINSDAFNTVSPTYAKEIMTPDQGAGLYRLIKKNKDKLSGILNGLDVDHFNPATDPHIYKRYSVDSLELKVKNKLKLQKELGLEVNADKPLIAMVSRLAWQKGLELIREDWVRDLDMQLVVLGTGETKYENHLKNLAKKYPSKMIAQIMFDGALAQKIYAASDMFLMPSRYEPCGLGQMISMRYGSVPVVRATGGLADTVDSKVGFSFKKFSYPAFSRIIRIAVNTYYNNPKKFIAMQKAGMQRDFTWTKSAKKYLKLYKELVK